ncbi:ATP-binding protein [Flavobacterium caeni]|uniref:Histidine kinase-, DNA gyrase B-, and HSP90-like ATPase n=1 Tax=Flavobacterium caeni TaxID=490189 RepID=A0A1G5FD97_9FLAO|nr:ATP-binding protein [Flavobacterium caeni]SCY37121.1 Histidine kinase-, DNA gyrase B-, and HSP90-like ATPase [Flavobacterium caeni]
MEQFNLSPSPALLDLLGKIPFKGWQCVAELVDNSIDAIISNESLLQEYQKQISVHIPTKKGISENQPLVIEDWGIGMNSTQLENAVRAGFSSKKTSANLGLFGMGFNVATSRLANVVQIWTSTVEMDKEIGVCIDLREMKKEGSFYRPKMERVKSNKSSGTRIEIFDFKDQAVGLLQSKTIIKELQRAYSEKIFDEYRLRILINNEEIKPFKFCVWDKTRTVKHKYEEVPAYIGIDKHWSDQMFCEECLTWIGDIPVDTSLNIACPKCSSNGSIIRKNISISGWVGIQRFSDVDHYGIDISRNGRILSKLDKTFFVWEEGKEDSPDKFDPEYPRDTTYAGGRIVGQLEANFVVPKYTKDDFERDDINWKRVINFIRGEMPLQPELGAQRGYKFPNHSPIGRLFSAYRKVNQPGAKTLCFGKENGNVDHITPKNWAQKFYGGDPEFQTDKKWWEAVVRADMKDGPPDFDPLNPLPKPLPSPKLPDRANEPEIVEKFPGKKIFRKTLSFDLENTLGEKPFVLTLMDYYPTENLELPIIFDSKGSMGKFDVYINNKHHMFLDFADGYEDLIFMEMAAKYSQLKNSDNWPVTRIYYELKLKYAPSTMLSVPNLVSNANKLMRKVQNKLIRGEGYQLPKIPSLSQAEEISIKKKYIDLEKEALIDYNDLLSTTGFLKYIDLNYLFKFIDEFPELVYDGKVFDLPYSDLDSETKVHQKAKYSSYLSDVRWFMIELANEGDEAVKKMKQEIIRNRYSIELLDERITV